MIFFFYYSEHISNGNFYFWFCIARTFYN